MIFKNHQRKFLFSIIFMLVFLGRIFSQNAPGGPGADPIWCIASKVGVGTSYEKYLNEKFLDTGPTGKISKVWFSIAEGILTETAYGRIDKAQIKDLQFLITGPGFFDEEKKDTTSTVEYLYTDQQGRPLSLAYKIINTAKNGKYRIEKHIFTDPDRQVLFIRIHFTAYDNNITPYLLINPHMNNTGTGDYAYVTNNKLVSYENGTYLVVKSDSSFDKTSAGFVGTSDGWQDLNDNGQMDWEYQTANYNQNGINGGNVTLFAKLNTISNSTSVYNFTIAFGNSDYNAEQDADDSLSDGYQLILDRYNGKNYHIGWEDYLNSLNKLPELTAYTGDQGKQLYASALVLKALEDKENAGALIASLSIPWGDTINAANNATGYRAVWPRDFYQCASALLALGDTETPIVSFKYLNTVQVKSGTPGNQGATGWFLQKTEVNGKLEWFAVQLDQTAMPIMLGWKLWKSGLLSDSEINWWYNNMLKDAAQFLKNGGYVNLGWNQNQINPPHTQQERWEEQAGYSPSTTASVITGLICAAEIARNAGYNAEADSYELKADQYEGSIENIMFTTQGSYGNGKYFLRITPDQDPNNNSKLSDGNGAMNNENEKKILDAGFIELVRYGVRGANNSYITDSINEIDDVTIDHKYRIKYEFDFDGKKYPGYRRYGVDGYGERTSDGSNFRDGGSDRNKQRGRVWPFFTGERGHYELEKIKKDNNGIIDQSNIDLLVDTYVKGMEYFANEGLMLPEQVWDGVGSNNTHQFEIGEGTNSATPLAWTHAEYIKLIRSLKDQNIWDSYPNVIERYQSTNYNTHFGNSDVHLTGENFDNWNPASSYKLTLVDNYVWETDITITNNLINTEYKITLGNWNDNWGGNASGLNSYLSKGGQNAKVTLQPGQYKLRITEGSYKDDKLHVQWIKNGNEELIIHFKEWTYCSGNYILHTWNGLNKQYNMEYEGEYDNGHWWKVSIPDPPSSFNFTFTNTDGKWEGGSQYDRQFNNNADEIWIKHHDTTIYLNKP